jgi:hypothetical protein
VVHLVQVDVVGAQPPQGVFTGAADFHGAEPAPHGQVLLVLAHVAEDLGGEDDLFAAHVALGEPAADDLLGDAFAFLAPVDVGGVEEVDAQVEGLVHHGEAVGFGGVGAEVHGAQAQAGHTAAGASERGVLHARCSFPLRGLTQQDSNTPAKAQRPACAGDMAGRGAGNGAVYTPTPRVRKPPSTMMVSPVV